MITKRQLLQAIVGLIQVNDFALLRQEKVLREMADERDLDRVKLIASVIKSLRDDFDYTKSSEFAASVAGKSLGFVEMKRRLLSDPRKVVEQRNRFDAVLLELPDVTRLRLLVAPERDSEIDRLAHSVSLLRNPD